MPLPPRPEPRLAPRPRALAELDAIELPRAPGDTEPSAAPGPAEFPGNSPKFPGNSTAPPPVNPTLREIYALIDQRLSPQIIQRISSIPPSEASKPAPSSSIRAAARKSYVVTKISMAVLGLSVVLLEAAAERLAERYPHLQGPLEALFEVALRLLKGAP